MTGLFQRYLEMVRNDDVAGLRPGESRFDYRTGVDQRTLPRLASLQVDPVHLEFAQPGPHHFFERARLADALVTI